jgi:dTDP-4-amino-4,6-dideoxygalactose transaminase
VNDERLIQRAEVIREKGTNRSQFFRGEVDKYTWVDIGSSYLPSELIAAFLWAQMEEAETITTRRLSIWQTYHEAFKELEETDYVRRPRIPSHCKHNAHMYYLLMPDIKTRTAFIDYLKRHEIHCVFHYVPLHTAPAGRRFGRVHGSMENTARAGDCLVRLPLWVGLEEQQTFIVERVLGFFFIK